MRDTVKDIICCGDDKIKLWGFNLIFKEFWSRLFDWGLFILSDKEWNSNNDKNK